MNILFLTLASMENISERGIYTDLVRELSIKGESVYVVAPRQKRTGLKTECIKEENINVLKVSIGNITQTKSFVEKGISTIQIENQYLYAIKKYYKGIKFDLIMYSTPPITFSKIIAYLKKRDSAKTYLILKDIFPQNAVDINLLKENGILHKYFRKKEEYLYEQSDVIGCMSKGNVEYVIKHNKNINREKLEIFPNAIKPIPKENLVKKNKDLLKKYNIDPNSILFVYGGNLGKPQGIDFLLEVIDNFFQVSNGHLLIVGSGTEYDRVKLYIENHHYENVSILNSLSKEEYDEVMLLADVGLIFLDNRFTIPNFPSRLTSYMENSLPILAATDTNTDLKDIIEESRSGFWCESGDTDTFIRYAQILATNCGQKLQMGMNGRDFLEKNYDITYTINIILKHLYGENINVQE